MASIALSAVDFHYHSPYTQVFNDLSLTIDSEWRTAVVGRNGRGKTTLLRLVQGSIQPSRGSVSVPMPVCYFPYEPADPTLNTRGVIKEYIAPYSMWEMRMDELLARGDEESLNEYGELLERYQDARGYEIDALIEREIAEMGMRPDILDQSFETLSGGEGTRALIVALFLKEGSFPLIDEPTNHLDMKGRELLGNYLLRKRGFIVVSHDRYFLDICADHILSINRGDVRVNKGNYSEWRMQMEIEEEHELRRHQNLQREIGSLERAAQQRRSWSNAKEKEKQGAYDKGYIGHKAANMMKRALHVEARMEDKIEEKKDLLQNYEVSRSLKLEVESKSPEILLSVENLSVELEGRKILKDFSLTLRKGERVAIIGPNGCGKTTLLHVIAGEIEPVSGTVHLPKYLTTARAYQNPLWKEGGLREHLKDAAIDETKFRNIMAAFGVTGEIFERPLETFSQGERKKVDLCRSLLDPVHLLLWDEPMNYIDLMSREQIEVMVEEYEPTMLFVEHDRRFVEGVATRVVEMESIQN